MMITPEPQDSKRADLQHIELQLSAKDLTFLFAGFTTLLGFIGAGFVVFNNEVCKPALLLNVQEIRTIQLEIQQIKEKLREQGK